MKYIFFVLLIAIWSQVYGQPSKIKTIRVEDGYSYYNGRVRDSFYLHLPEVRNSGFQTHIRITDYGKTVDIFSTDGDMFHGVLINNIVGYKKVKRKCDYHTKLTKVYYQLMPLNDSLCTYVAGRILNSGQHIVPGGKLNETRELRFQDCGNVQFKFNVNKLYAEQSYHCLLGQPDSIKYIKTASSNFKLVKDVLKTDSFFRSFEAALTNGKTYTNNGHILLRLLTKKETGAQIRARQRKNYIEWIGGRIDTFLLSALAEQKSLLAERDWYPGFRIIFAANGKLKKVVPINYDQPCLWHGLSFYLEERAEIRKCRYVIKKALKNVDLSSFHLKYNFEREIEVEADGTVNLYKSRMSYW